MACLPTQQVFKLNAIFANSRFSTLVVNTLSLRLDHPSLRKVDDNRTPLKPGDPKQIKKLTIRFAASESKVFAESFQTGLIDDLSAPSQIPTG